MGNMSIMNKIDSPGNLELRTNTKNLETGLANDGEQEWYAPISDATQIAGFARASGPGGPLGDPPTRLIRVSVSEGTL